ELQKRFFTRLPQTELHNTYGPTETCVEATYYPYRPQEELTTALVPIGYPIRNVQAYILDAHGQPVPHGVSGELHLGGACVTRGYHNRPDLTAEKYVPNPFLQANEQADGVDARLYKTGDIVRLLPDGAMEFLGRVDHQVKIRGFRIELGEIESLLLSLEGVREVTVVAREDVSGDKRIVAYLVAESGAAPMQVVSVQRDVASHDRLQEPENASSNTSQQLRSYLQSRLPEYMVPSTFVWLDAMPLTSSGKTDRKALPAPERQVDSSTYVAPRDGLELEMARLWEEVLDLAAVGIHDNFFLIGGHSLKALALSNRIKEQFGVTLPLALLFQAPTVADLCRHVRAHRDGEEQILIPLQQGTSSQPPLFLIHPQGGGVLSYFHLVRELGTEQTVYGLQAVGFESDREPLTSLEAMADLYLAEMRKVASRGPYRLAGWSFGGVLAYELARRLEAEDEGVEFFGLLDAMPPSADTTELLGSSGSERQALEEYALAYGVSQEELSDLNEDDLLDAIIRKGEALLLLPTGTSPATVRQKLRVMMACGEAQATYQPTNRLRTDIHLFYVQERAEGFANDLIDPQDWVAYTDGDLLAHPVPGHHHNMVEPPHVQTLAARIKQALTTRARV
ncbi:MAG TPA: thioesterase domain-containing protein, partial [Bacilli bacterium]|nr:thioesterase domain-containing protein [Bacilli bacterium]